MEKLIFTPEQWSAVDAWHASVNQAAELIKTAYLKAQKEGIGKEIGIFFSARTPNKIADGQVNPVQSFITRGVSGSLYSLEIAATGFGKEGNPTASDIAISILQANL